MRQTPLCSVSVRQLSLEFVRLGCAIRCWLLSGESSHRRGRLLAKLVESSLTLLTFTRAAKQARNSLFCNADSGQAAL
jgi:hypothetical protein